MMMKSKAIPLVILVIAAVGGGVAAARPPATPDAQPKALTDVLACRAITDSAARLSCFDASAAALDTATAKRDVVVVDREQVGNARRSLFGFTLPSLRIFGGDDDSKAPDNRELDTTVQSARQNGDGRWVVVIAEGAVWRQIDDTVIGRAPKPGTKVVIRKAALTSYMMRFEGQPGFRVHRDN